MADIYLNRKPVTNAFTYAYVEDADGKLMRIALDDMKVLLGVGYIDGTITVLTDNWTASADGTYYTQELVVPNATQNSRINLDPSPTQLIQIMKEEITMFVGNDNGKIAAYAYNGYPSTNMTIKIRITEDV